MISRRSADFFRIDLPETVVFLPASDFQSAASADCFKLGQDQALGLPVAAYRGSNYPCILLEPVFKYLFAVDGSDSLDFPPTVFFRGVSALQVDTMYSGAIRKDQCAFLLARNFQMVSLSLAELRLPPAGIRPRLGESGVIAMRFVPGEKTQFILDVSKYYPMPLAIREESK
jgi:hypothetical protein